MHEMTLAVIVGNRDFFPDHLVTEARRDILAVFGEMGIEPVILEERQTKLGAVETWAHAQQCAELFRANRDRIDGVLVSLPNFGDEKGVADTLKLAGLNVPVLVQAYPDDLEQLDPARRRDAFCGKISVCNNLRQYGIPFSLTALHTVHPRSPEFRKDLQEFLAVCRVVRGLRRARIGAVGARPDAFNTMRYSEKLLEASGISVIDHRSVRDLRPGAANSPDADPRVKAKLDEIGAYADASAVPAHALVQMAKFGVVLLDWMDGARPRRHRHPVLDFHAAELRRQLLHADEHDEREADAQRLRSGRHRRRVDVCAAARLRNARAPWWTGTTTTATTRTSACSSTAATGPRASCPTSKIATAPILGTTLGEENTYGALAGRTPAGPVTFARVSTDDRSGRIRTYVGEGQFTDDPLETFGTRAVVQVPELQTLMRYVCKNGFEHHVAMNASHCAGILAEAFETYLSWDVYHHPV